ncbi:MAG: tetratricopeptide repeat protein [Verrucomicrobiota bacterium]
MRRFAPFLALLAAVLLVYAPALRDGWVWDDTALVLRDPLIRSPFLLTEGFRHFLFLDATASDFYRPLQRAVYTLDYALAGFTPWVFHLTSLLVHAGAALALYAFGRRLLAWPGVSANPGRFCLPAFAAALVWAIHPIHTSAVVYVSGLADPLAALCGLGGLALLMGGRRIAAGLCLGAALFAKESGAFAVVLGLAAAGILARREGKPLAAFARVAVPALALAVLYLGLRVSAERTPPPPPAPLPLAARAECGLRAVAEYGGLLAAPRTLRMERNVRTSPWGGWQTLAGAVLLGAGVCWCLSARPAGRACLLAAGAAYLPVSNLLALNATVAEHWVYVPSAFLFLAAADGLSRRRLPDRRFAIGAAALAGAWLAALGVRTTVRCGDWRDQETFLRATLRDGGRSSRMLGNLALLALGRGDTGEAVRGFREALALEPNQPFARLGLGNALLEHGDFAEARACLEDCAKNPLLRSLALVRLAELDRREMGRDPVERLREAAQAAPRFWPARKQYIARLLQRRDAEPALHELRAVLAQAPYRAETWGMLSRALEQIGRPDLARAAAAQAALRDVWWGKN